MVRALPLLAALTLATPAAAQQAVIDIPPKPAKAAPAKSKAAPAKKAPATKPAAEGAAKPAAAAAKNTAKPKAAAKPAAKPKSPKLTDTAARDGFGILQVAAPDAAKFTAAWRAGTASSTISTRTVADQPLFVFIVFHGCKADAEGKCDLSVDYAIHRPDGSTDDDHKGLVVWNRAAPTDAAKPVLGDGALGFGTDSEGPFGDYRIVATVTDKVAGVTLTTQQVLTVAPAPATVEGPKL